MIFVDYPGHLIAIGMALICITGLWLAFKGPCLKRLGLKRWVLCLLPLAAMLILHAIFFNPSSVQMSEQSRPCTVQVYFDTSRSMSVEDAGSQSRLDYAVSLFQTTFLKDDSAGPRYQVFGFDQQCYAADSIDTLSANGEQSNLNDLWRRVYAQSEQEERAAGSPVTGVIIFTDGQADDQNLASYMAIDNDEFPVVLIPVGASKQQPDVQVHSLKTPAKAAVNAMYPGQVTVETRQLRKQPIQVDILQNDHVIASHSFTPKIANETNVLDFEVGTSSTGLDKIEVIAKMPGQELNVDNNRQIRMVNVVSNDKRRVLLYSQVAGFDLGKIRQALKRDEKIDLDFRLDAIKDPAVLQNNPNLNQQVKLPTEAEKLNDFDVLILGPMDYNALTDSEVQNLYSFVSTRGGAIIFLSGKEEYALSNIQDSDICSLLPVRFESNLMGADYTANPTLVSLTPEGKAMELFATIQTSTSDWSLITGYHNVSKKPAASTLFSFNQDPFVCVQRVGRGYVSFLNSFTLFQLYQSDREGGALQELMSSLISYVSRISAEESRIDLSANINRYSEKMVFEACVRDGHYKPVDGATVLLDVNGRISRMAPASDGRYTVTREDLKPGAIYAVVKAELGGNFLGEKKMILDLPQKHDEMSRTEANVTFLSKMADHTGAMCLNPYQVNEDTKGLFKAQHTLQQKAQPMPVWHNWLVILVLCGILTANWFIRRAMGLV